MSPFVTGEKVYFRGIEEGDVDGPYLEWVNDREVTRFLSTVGRFPTDKEGLLNYIQGMAQSQQDVLFAIHDAETDQFIGTTHLGPINWIMRVAPLGVMIGDKDFWGRGYASEAIRLAVQYGFETLNLQKITAGIAAIHEASVKAFQKAGFEIEGRAKRQFFLDGTYYDSLYLGRTREGFRYGLDGGGIP